MPASSNRREMGAPRIDTGSSSGMSVCRRRGPATAGGQPGFRPNCPPRPTFTNPSFVHHPTGTFTAAPFKGTVTNYHLTNGVRFPHGYLYRGFNHNHWSRIYVHPVYNVRVYF